MINSRKAKGYCKDYTHIENYEEAISDKTQTWECHHILGEILTTEQLKLHNFYYDVPPCMLKFVTPAEHRMIHKRGKCLSDETKTKLSKAKTGKNNPWYGKHHTEESRKKISDASKGRVFSEESRRKISEAVKRSHQMKRQLIITSS